MFKGRKHVLKFMGCRSFRTPKTRTPSKLTEKIFEPAIQILVGRGYLIDGMYTVEGDLNEEYFYTRPYTRKFVDGLLKNPQDDIIVCTWYDDALKEGERLIEAEIPVEYLMLFGAVDLYFPNGTVPENTIVLSDNWNTSVKNFVKRIAHCIDNLKT